MSKPIGTLRTLTENEAYNALAHIRRRLLSGEGWDTAWLLDATALVTYTTVDDEVIVPREATDEMNSAGGLIGDYPWDGKKPSRIWAAMIAACDPEKGA